MKGQALVTLIFFMLFATTVTTAAVFVIATNSISGAKLQEGTIAYQAAESGIDNALVRLLRDPVHYTGETGLVVGSGTVDITISGAGTIANPYIILSKGKKGSFVKQIQATAHFDSMQQLILDSQKEVF